MADNVELDAGSGGAVLAADEIAGVVHQRVKVQFGADGSATDASPAAPFPVEVISSGDTIDTNNSTTSALVGDASFEPASGTDALGYHVITVTLYADVDSAEDGMVFQFSTDDSNWDDEYVFTMDVSSQDTRRFQFPVTARYFRLSYTNGSGAQSAFRVQTILHAGSTLTSIHRVGDDMSLDRSAEVSKSVLFAKDSVNNLFKPVSIHSGGQLEVQAHAGDDGGADIFRSLDVDETEEQIKATAGNVYWVTGFNEANATRYLKIYNDTAANVVVGTTTPVLTLPLTKEVAFQFAITQGLYFDTAITVAATTGLADNNTGAPGANDVVCNVGYK